MTSHDDAPTRPCRLPARMPADWSPLVDGFFAGFAEQVRELIVAVYGLQGTPTTDGFGAAAALAFEGEDGPASVQYGHIADAHGGEDHVVIAHWSAPDAFARWEAAHPWPAWCRRASGAGVWREVLRVPIERAETLLSSPLILWGLAGARDRLVGPIRKHGYWGAMRDRLPASAYDALEAAGDTAPLAQSGGDGRRVVAPGGNLAVICSGQDWSRCEPAHADYYLRELQPKLRAAMADLAARGASAGNLGCRFVRMTDAAGRPLDASFGLAYFRALSDLEHWAANDPLHLDIHRSFIDHKRRTQTTLRLWHEVLVLPQGQCFEYLDCRPGTGLAAAHGGPPSKPQP